MRIGSWMFWIRTMPTSASWLNQVERLFAELTGKRLRRGVFRSVIALEKAIRGYLNERNDNAEPFRWTANADLILDRVRRACLRIYESLGQDTSTENQANNA